MNACLSIGSPTENTYVALLRGVNVGGRNKLPMKDLTSMFRAIGCDSVQIYIQSGNVVFRADPKLAGRVPDLIAESITNRFRYTIPVIVRSATELFDVVGANPFAQAGAESNELHAVFLASSPSLTLGSRLDPDRSPGDKFLLVGRDVFLHCPQGLARSKLTNAWFDSNLQTTSTMRNWRTVRKLLELTSA